MDGFVIDGVILELDIQTSAVLWRWSAIEHVPLTNTRATLNGSREGAGNGSFEKPFDYFHLNAFDVVDDAHILVNGRHTWEVYLVEKATGSVVWTLNGETGGDFGAPPYAFVSWPLLCQELLANGAISGGNTILALEA